jgi:succinate dehydrogenase / fumarate reductase cytochrome b subunit
MTEATMKKERPKHLDLRVIKQPVPAIASILHRVSGAGLFLMLPFLIFLFELSLDSSLGFSMFKAFVGYPLVKLILIGLLWAFLHHFCMGVRILLLDLNIGTDLKPARTSAKAVIIISLVLTAILGAKLW